MNSFYTKEPGYHDEQLCVGDEAFQFIARARARKIEPWIEPHWSIFEYGVGTGLNIAELNCARRAGYDIAAHMVPELERLGVDFYLSIPEGQSYDFVLCHHALEHCPNPAESLQEIWRVLKPGGRLLLFVPYENERRYRRYVRHEPNHHLFSWNPQTIGNLVEAAGFTVGDVRCTPTGYERFVAEHFPARGSDVLFRAALFTLRAIRCPKEIRLVAHKRERA